MFWSDKLANSLSGDLQVINDSKTPSGRAHVGALRGPLIHDAIFRTLQSKGIPVRYMFGVDDYDPVDEIPYGEAEIFSSYLGAPLCNVPPPPGSKATDMADHYITEFIDVLGELGVRPEYYRMRDVYRSGKFNEVTDRILRNAEAVREVYRSVSGSERGAHWYPFQVICENCGRIGTTVVTEYNGSEVNYRCSEDLVKWARGCGYQGKRSPFDGNGKLPWKLEWCAKWHTFPVTIEGAGQDHNTKGGSRDVAVACSRTIFNEAPPVNCPYGFFLVGGAKMSSSRGVGVSARGMADFLPPEVLRFLLIRPNPPQPVNFEPSEPYIIKLFNDFDRYRDRYYHDANVSASDKRIYELSRVVLEPDYWVPDFHLLSVLAQTPHLDVMKELEVRKGIPLTEIEQMHLRRRMLAVQYWSDNYASDSEKTRLQERLPDTAKALSVSQKYFLQTLGRMLRHADWDADSLQATVFEAARCTPIGQPDAFRAFYRVFLDRDNGPKAGHLLAFLERPFAVQRCSELPINLLQFWAETAISVEEFENWLSAERENTGAITAKLELASNDEKLPTNPYGQTLQSGMGIIEFLITMKEGKRHVRRVFFEEFRSLDSTFDQEFFHFETYAREWLATLGAIVELHDEFSTSGDRRL